MENKKPAASTGLYMYAAKAARATACEVIPLRSIPTQAYAHSLPALVLLRKQGVRLCPNYSWFFTFHIFHIFPLDKTPEKSYVISVSVRRLPLEEAAL
jgi:hypothetical protein